MARRPAETISVLTYRTGVQDANLAGVLTDQPAGKDASELPFDEMLRAHAKWCETGGRSGTPSVFDGADLRSLKSLLEAPGRVL